MKWMKRLVRSDDTVLLCDVLHGKQGPLLRSQGIDARDASPEALAEARTLPELGEADLAGIINVRG